MRSFSAVERYAGLSAIAACFLYRLSHMAKENSELPTSKVFTDVEIQTLRLIEKNNCTKAEMKKVKPHTIAWAVLIIAYLGGYVSSNKQPPGPQVLSRGYERFQEQVKMLLFLHEQTIKNSSGLDELIPGFKKGQPFVR